MQSMGPAKRTKLFQFKFVRYCSFIFGGCIVTLLTVFACKRYNISHYYVPGIENHHLLKSGDFCSQLFILDNKTSEKFTQ